MKIIIIFYSGVGNTKMVATKIKNNLINYSDISLISIEDIDEKFDFTKYDAAVIGFPTIHSSPAKPMLNFIEEIIPLTECIPAFLFTTCGLYSANTLRIFAKKAITKNIKIILCKTYRCSAIDGILLAPSMNIWSKSEKNLDAKIYNDSLAFIKLINIACENSLPPFKFYSILNYPNKILGRWYSPMIYTHKEKCICCKKCVIACPVHCINEEIDGYPIVDKKNCISCYRCIHHCPRKALSLSKKKTPIKTMFF